MINQFYLNIFIQVILNLGAVVCIGVLIYFLQRLRKFRRQNIQVCEKILEIFGKFSKKEELEMKIDVKNLRQLTQAAVVAGEAEARRQEAALMAAAERQRVADENHAAEIIAQIPHKCEMEARNRRSHCIVMSLRYDKDYKTDFKSGNFNKLEPYQLRGAGEIVWKACLESDLKPAIEYWHDGMGMESGFNIVVKW